MTDYRRAENRVQKSRAQSTEEQMTEEQMIDYRAQITEKNLRAIDR